jgi:hypothetical protein
MCFTGKFFDRKKTAKEDIVCYKIGYFMNDELNVLHSYFAGYIYVKGYQQPKIKIRKRYDLNNIIDWRFKINEGYHSYKYVFCAHLANVDINNLKIEKFIIPKGTVYYENNYEYVSENIIWVGNE